MYDWNPETGTDNRPLIQSADDTKTTQNPAETPVSNCQDATNSSSSKSNRSGFFSAVPKTLSSIEHMKYYQEDSSLHAAQLLATACEDTINKTFTVNQSTSVDKSLQLNTSDQVIHSDDDTMSKTFTIKRNDSLETKEELNTSDQITHDNSKQKPGKVPILTVMDIIPSLDENASYDNKISAVYNAEKNSHVLSNDNHSNISNKNKVSNSEHHPENAEEKFPSVTSEKLVVTPKLSTTISSSITDSQQFADNNFIISTSRMNSLNDAQKIPEMLPRESSVANDISSQSTIHKSGDIAKSTNNSNNTTTKNVLTILTPNKTSTNNMTNEINWSDFPKTSMNGDMTRNITDLRDNDILKLETVFVANTSLQQLSHHSIEKQKTLHVINSLQINSSQNDASHHNFGEKNHEFNENLNNHQIGNNLPQSVIQKSENYDFISTKQTPYPEMYLLAAAENPNFIVEEFENSTSYCFLKSLKISTTTQTDFDAYPYDCKNYSDLRKNIHVENTSQKQLIIIDNKNTYSITAIADKKTQVTPRRLENCTSNRKNRQCQA